MTSAPARPMRGETMKCKRCDATVKDDKALTLSKAVNVHDWG
jgi:hypothetical protein